jgi:hypothetical protein
MSERKHTRLQHLRTIVCGISPPQCSRIAQTGTVSERCRRRQRDRHQPTFSRCNQHTLLTLAACTDLPLVVRDTSVELACSAFFASFFQRLTRLQVGGSPAQIVPVDAIARQPDKVRGSDNDDRICKVSFHHRVMSVAAFGGLTQVPMRFSWRRWRGMDAGP